MTAALHPSYRGRFAPTPSGPLHLGSLVMATASWLDARHHHGHWLLRIDDIDPPREQPGAADTIQRQLEAVGLHWDETVIHQGLRHDRYAHAVDKLISTGDAFYCTLSRKELEALEQIHPGPSAAVPASADAAIRVQVPQQPVCFDDAVCGRYCLDLQADGGAFVIRRRDGLFAYQLACAVDDACNQDLRISHVLRGDDLLASTPRQLWLMQRLGNTAPHYAHLPVITDSDGNKLAKSIGSASISALTPAEAMYRALAHLGIRAEAGAPPAQQLQQALDHWRSPFSP